MKTLVQQLKYVHYRVGRRFFILSFVSIMREFYIFFFSLKSRAAVETGLSDSPVKPKDVAMEPDEDAHELQDCLKTGMMKIIQ